MAETSSQDRLQPSLLDRLTDLRPSETSEPNEKRVLSQQQLRRSVVRDLEWLLNTGDLKSVLPLTDFPEIERSVLNFGVPDLAGSTVSGIDLGKLTAELKQAIILFEPRINRRTLEVRGEISDDKAYKNAITFEISAEMWGDPAPIHLMLKTEMDLESGQVAVQDYGA